MVKRQYLCVCEFSDGKGEKEAKKWAPEWGGMWVPRAEGTDSQVPS